jgi:hypothetical protein
VRWITLKKESWAIEDLAIELAGRHRRLDPVEQTDEFPVAGGAIHWPITMPSKIGGADLDAVSHAHHPSSHRSRLMESFDCQPTRSQGRAVGALGIQTTRQEAIFTCINDFETSMITPLLSLLLSPLPREPRPADSPPMTECRVGRRSLPGRRR